MGVDEWLGHHSGFWISPQLTLFWRSWRRHALSTSSHNSSGHISLQSHGGKPSPIASPQTWGRLTFNPIVKDSLIICIQKQGQKGLWWSKPRDKPTLPLLSFREWQRKDTVLLSGSKEYFVHPLRTKVRGLVRWLRRQGLLPSLMT